MGLFHQSVPGVPSSPLAIGVPMPFLLHNVVSLKAIPNTCSLATHYLREGGCKDLKDGEIKALQIESGKAAAIPTWTGKVQFLRRLRA